MKREAEEDWEMKRPKWLGEFARYEIRQAQKGAAANRSTDERPEKTSGRSSEEKCPFCPQSAQVSPCEEESPV